MGPGAPPTARPRPFLVYIVPRHTARWPGRWVRSGATCSNAASAATLAW